MKRRMEAGLLFWASFPPFSCARRRFVQTFLLLLLLLWLFLQCCTIVCKIQNHKTKSKIGAPGRRRRVASTIQNDGF